MSGDRRRAPRGGAAATLLCALCAYGFRDWVVLGTSLWLAMLALAYLGWGQLLCSVQSAVTRWTHSADSDATGSAAQTDAAFAAPVMLTIGASCLVALCGLALALDRCDGAFLHVMILSGVLLTVAYELRSPQPYVATRLLGMFTRRALPWWGLAVVGFSYVALAAFDQSANPWDDEVIYLPLVKRLLDSGDLLEPFSFRRMGAYGGQTILQATVGLRGDLVALHALDRGLFFAVSAWQLLGFARAQRIGRGWTALVLLALATLPWVAINTASFWTGIAMFAAMYWVLTNGGWRYPIVLGVLAAALVTLRSNFFPVVGLLLAWSASATWRNSSALSREKLYRAVGLAVFTFMVVGAPYGYALHRSSDTWLFPLMKGNWNQAIDLNDGYEGVLDFAQAVVRAAIESNGLLLVLPVAMLAFFVFDARPGRPLQALFVASVGGFFILVKSLMFSEPSHLWRYCLGFAVPLAMFFWLELAPSRCGRRVRAAPAVTVAGLIGLVLQVGVGLRAAPRYVRARFVDVHALWLRDWHGDNERTRVQRDYTELQHAIPRGTRAAVLLDDAHYLDFARNRLFLLDIPGFVAPGGNMPAFVGAEAKAAYWQQHGIRYVLFVRSEASHHAFRRAFWVKRMVTDATLFSVMSIYSIEMIDVLEELARTRRVLWDRQGLVAVDLELPP